jgi:hypothetical protein
MWRGQFAPALFFGSSKVFDIFVYKVVDSIAGL